MRLPPEPPAEQPPRSRYDGIDATFIVAALEHLGFFSPEQALCLDALSETIIPFDYVGARSAVIDQFDQMPCWDSCPQCRALVWNFKSGLPNFHNNGHQDVQQEQAE